MPASLTKTLVRILLTTCAVKGWAQRTNKLRSGPAESVWYKIAVQEAGVYK